jgi:RNA polymerase sigma factor (sigma-70 family)
LIKSIQDRVFTLAVKMLYFIPDAEDAVQEILIKIVTRLNSFKKQSSFCTWAMKIASNHLLNKRAQLNRHEFTFKNCEDMIVRPISIQPPAYYQDAEHDLILQEMRIICVQGLFQCLDWDHRIVYIIGETMDFSGPEGAAILGISSANFRKRLSRSRERIRKFLIKNCDLFDEENPCNCNHQANRAIDKGFIDPNHPQHQAYAKTRKAKINTAKQLRQMEQLARETFLTKIHPDYSAPSRLVARIREMLDTGKFQTLNTLS